MKKIKKRKGGKNKKNPINSIFKPNLGTLFTESSVIEELLKQLSTLTTPNNVNVVYSIEELGRFIKEKEHSQINKLRG